MSKGKLEFSKEELRYFRDYPEELQRLTRAESAKGIYLRIALVVGVVLVLIYFMLKVYHQPHFPVLYGAATDLLFEGGVALWGAAVTVYMLEILMDRQEVINAFYRQEIQRQIETLEDNDAEGTQGQFCRISKVYKEFTSLVYTKRFVCVF